ncbi:hypothetical protein SAY87_024456 [Trapa incisa]|uniref:Uncharacterized protein n=1 Tax=Trapa incisa TaxID=236973 RepID=A0AAN7GJX2_9MYRT|nr:hypothetical protein SAY87_024456 [Trapa incisa]
MTVIASRAAEHPNKSTAASSYLLLRLPAWNLRLQRLSNSKSQHNALSDKLLEIIIYFACFIQLSLASRMLSEAVVDQAQPLQYHKGPLLTGKISVNLIWYGNFKPSQRAIISDFVASLTSSADSATKAQSQPSVAAWWKQIEKYYHLSGSKKAPLSLFLGTQLLDDSYSLGKSLTDKKITELASRGQQKDAINVVLTASDVTVDGFCMSRCGSHGSASGTARARRGLSKFAYVWIGDSTSQCPGQCAWPFHQPIYGPQSPPLVAPNNDTLSHSEVNHTDPLFSTRVLRE